MGVIVRAGIVASTLWLALIFGGYLLKPAPDADEQLLAVILFAFVPIAAFAIAARVLYWVINGR